MRLGELALGCPRSQTEVLCQCWHGVGLGFSERAPSPAQTAPSEGFTVGCARQSNRELYLYEELQVQPLSQGVRAVAKQKDAVGRGRMSADSRPSKWGRYYCYFLKRRFRSRWNLTC